VWTENGRSREQSTGTRDRSKAEIALAKFIQQRRRTTGPRDPSEILVTDLLTEYAEQQGPKVAAPIRIACAIMPLAEFFEGRSVTDVTTQICMAYEKWRRLSAGTVRRELGVLRASINHAYRNGRITRPVAVDLPPPPPGRDRWLTRQEAARLLRAAKTPQARLYMPLFILIALYTGRRKQAILSLRWPQVDLVAGKINFNPPGRNETNKRRGVVKISPRLLPHLKRARLRGTELGYVLHVNGERLGDIKTGFKGACRRADIEGVSPHTLKHTAATWLMQAGTPLWEAAGFLATSVETLERRYAHHHPDFQQTAAENIGRRPRNVRVIA
jgi:integrase